MKIWQVILATLVIFGTGVVTGGLLVDYSNRGQRPFGRGARKPEIQRPPVNGMPVREPEKFPQPIALPARGLSTNFIARLDRELKLTPEQHERIVKIITESQERTKELWKPVEQPMKREMMETKQKIRAELTPEQQKKFEMLMQRPQQRKPDEPPSPENRMRPRDNREQRPLPPQDFPEPPRNP